LRIANVAGSQCIINGGNIYIRKPSTTASTPEFDFGSSNVYHNVIDGHVYFGDASTSYTFDYMPYVSYTYPHFEVLGTTGTLLKPYTFINSRMLSLKINLGNTFDISSGGTNGSSTQISLTDALDGMYGFYNEGTFLERNGQIILSGTVPQYYYSAVGEYNIYNLTVNNTAGVYLDMPMNIVNSLTLTNGIIYSSSANLLTINHNATVTGASNTSYVNGPVKKIGNAAFTFPVGKSNMYRALSISAPSLDTDEYTAEFFYISPDPTYDRTSHAGSLDHISDVEYWNLDRGAGASTVNVTLTWNASSGGVDDLVSLRIAQWDGLAWQDNGNGGTTGTTAAGTIVTSSPTTSFGPFTLASQSSSNNPLPIELAFFTAESKDNYNLISWTTLTEKNNDYFVVERTVDGTHYDAIAEIDGAGNSLLPINYSIKDITAGDKVCYRLKQVDFNGDFSYSQTECVSRNKSGSAITIKPNIIRDENIVIDLGGNNFRNASLYITDLTGKKLYENKINDGIHVILRNEVSFDAKGIYFVTLITDDNIVHSNRIVVI
jgi:hypothetical protein